MVKLEKMLEDDFKSYIGNAIKDYAKEKVKAGTWAEKESLEKSKEDFDRLLPNGVNTEKQHLFAITDYDLDIKVGYIWVCVFEKLIGREGFIYDFIIFEKFRGKGYGRQTMEALDDKAKELKLDKLSLHVFGHNHIALELYKKMGYVATDINMSKIISREQVETK